MKKYIYTLFLFSFGVALFTNQSLFGQFERLEISYNVEETVVKGKTVYNLEVSVDHHTNKIIFSLYKDAPTLENLIKESKPTKKNVYRFENLPPGHYSIKVFESSTKGGFESIDLGN